MRLSLLVCTGLLISLSLVCPAFPQNPAAGFVHSTDWLRTARIATPYGIHDSWEAGVAGAVEQGANVILDWATCSDDYYGRIVNPEPGLQELATRAAYIHHHYPEVHYMVYFAPLEMSAQGSDLNRDGRDDDGSNSTYTDHPHWLQVGIDGRPAVFYGSQPGMPFWVEETDEDVWLSPSNTQYRAVVMNLTRRLTATGVDAIWFDVPHLCFEFGDHWHDQWSSVDEASRTAFLADTGFTLPPPPLEPDWSDPVWQAFIDWRYAQIADYVEAVHAAMKAGNPACSLVVETSSAGVAITQHGCDLQRLSNVCDVVCHEYGGPYHEQQYYAWLDMAATLKFWRDMDAHSSWLLSYVDAGNIETAYLHAALVTTMGYNYYTSGDQTMTGVVNKAFLRQFYAWLQEHQGSIYGWNGTAEVALLFSRQTLDYLDRGRWDGYAYHDALLGTAMMLLASNIPFTVLTQLDPAALGRYRAVILPCCACLSTEQGDTLRSYVAEGGTLVALNETSLYDPYGTLRPDFLLADVFGVSHSQVVGGETYINDYGQGRSVYTPSSLGRYYLWAAAPWSPFPNSREAEKWHQEFNTLLSLADISPLFSIQGEAMALAYRRENQHLLRILNTMDVGRTNSIPTPHSVQVTLQGHIDQARVLDFMGQWQPAQVTLLGNTSVVSLELDMQCCLAYTVNTTPLYGAIEKPVGGHIYLFDREILVVPGHAAMVIGGVTVQVDTNARQVTFYADDVVKAVDSEPPFSWLCEEFSWGHRHLAIVAVDTHNNRVSDSVDVYMFNLA